MWRWARLDAGEALQVVVPVQQVRLEIYAADERGGRGLGAGEVEIREGRVAADGDGCDVVWVRRKGACDIDYLADMDSVACYHLLGVDGP